MPGMKVVLEIDLQINDDESVRVDSVISRVIKQTPDDPIEMERRLQSSELQYGILTLGAKTPIGRVLPLDSDIAVCFEGEEILAHTHAKAQGRIDRLTAIFKRPMNELCAGDRLKLSYNQAQNTLTISR